MQETYLEILAREIQENYPNPGGLCVVLPTKRAATFLKQALGKAYGKTVLAPTFLSQGEFVEAWSGLQKLDSMVLVLELYACYKNLEGEQAESFESFLKWAPTLLSDFSEVDRYLVDPDQIFGSINDARVIENWNLSGEPLTQTQEEYLKFWRLIGRLYKAFIQHLKNKGKAYQGLQYRVVAGKIEQIAQEIKFDKVLFAGFNALSVGEEQIIYGLIKRGKADVFWDADDYYMNDSAQEAGLFLRKIKERRNQYPFKWQFDDISKGKKSINVVACNTGIGQVRYAAEVLQKEFKQESGLKTAVVLNDGDLLMPLLYHLPSNVEAANITMGYSLKNAPLSGLIAILLSLWDNYRKEKERKAYYYKPFLQLLDHPYFLWLVGNDEKVERFKQTLIKNNVVYVNHARFDEAFEHPELSDWLFGEKKGVYAHTSVFLSIINALKGKVAELSITDVEKSLTTEYLFHFSKLFNQLQLILEEYPLLDKVSVKLFKKLFFQMIGSEQLAFLGEPLKGLQIMGMLETRLLDFNHIIMLSTNDGVLPAGKKLNSFIPYDIKRAFNLPTHIEQDAIFAHHFYRLVQRVKRMDLVYVTGQNDFGAATERSRFIEQMLFEMPAYNSGISIHEQTYSAPVKVTAEQVQIEATPQIQERLVEYLERKLSPSALNTFIRCPLDFFYRYALQLGEAEELEEQVQSSTFGTCVHETLEDLFEPFLGQDLKVQMIDQMLPKADRLVEQKFLKSYSVQDLKTGNNLLTFEVAKSYVKKFLELEKKNITQAQAAGLNYQKVLSEEKLELILPIEWDGKTVNVKIFGVADRIGRLGDQIQLIDYKTGNVTPSELAFNDWEELITNPKKAKALQLAIYGLAYLKKNPTNDFKAGIYSFRNLGAGLLELKKQKMPVDPQELLEEFPKVLGEGVARILHQTAFTHDEKSEYCNYC